MLKIKVIGIGAAGGKAIINLVEKGVVTQDQILLINSTAKDIPANYKGKAVLFDNATGCGKERSKAKDLALNSLKSGTINIDNFFDPDDQMCVIVASMEGGTGSGSSTIFAKYIKEVLGINVAVVGFSGFETDVRGMANTIEFMQDLNENYTVKIISNKKCLEGNNNLRAEQAANDELANRLNIIIAKDVIDSVQNIDDQDLYKVSTTPGYMYADRASLHGIKNVKDFNNVVNEMLDNNKSLDISEKSVKRLAVFLNIKDKTKDFIDFNFGVFKERLGNPYEIFTHVQEADGEESISYIASGMKLPLDEVKEIYDKYKEGSEKVNKAKDDFFNFANELRGNEEDSMFNVQDNEFKNPEVSKKDFFNSFIQSNKQPNNIKDKTKDIKDQY